MLLLLAIAAQRTVPPEQLASWVQFTRAAAIEVPGVYDLALYQKSASKKRRFWVALDVEDERATAAFWDDPEVRKALQRGERLGVQLIPQGHYQRLA